MARWEPGAPERLKTAALDLFASRGYERTTAADIAEAVGLTERTFFRHFADKREVLFDGQESVQEAFLTGVAAAPQGAPPIDVVASALVSAATFFPDDRREYSRRRQKVITAHPALVERELLKLDHLGAVLADALRARGVPEPSATIAARSGLTVFGVAFALWIAVGEQRSFLEIQEDVLGWLARVVGDLHSA